MNSNTDSKIQKPHFCNGFSRKAVRRRRLPFSHNAISTRGPALESRKSRSRVLYSNCMRECRAPHLGHVAVSVSLSHWSSGMSHSHLQHFIRASFLSGLQIAGSIANCACARNESADTQGFHMKRQVVCTAGASKTLRPLRSLRLNTFDSA